MDEQSQQSINVLKAWHLVEFFQAYSIPDKYENQITPVNISFNELSSQGNRILPWLNPECKSRLGISSDPKKKCTYTLYLGLFDKAVIDKNVSQFFAKDIQPHFVLEEIEQRRDNEGFTCFAKLMLDEFGTPLFDSFSVSTLPWALAELLAGRGIHITQDSFDARCDYLSEYLVRWEKRLSTHPVNKGRLTISDTNIQQLIQALYSWAGLSSHTLKLTASSPVYLFQMAFFETDRKEKQSLEDKKMSSNIILIKDNKDILDDETFLDEDDEEKKEEEASQLPILNSFYIRDVEKAINAIKSGEVSLPLQHYLQLATKKHADLYTNEAMTLIYSQLSPENTPEGRWLTEPEYNMSLMQQFAINTAFKDLQQGGLLSVNGPPGTGKTTLLRDIIAQNIVDRAKVIASFDKASEGLTPDGSLIGKLTGFEMVVASSNNAAVENISKELPLLSSIGKSFSDVSFLRPVANQLNAKNKKGVLQPLHDNERVWGNISAIMGAKKKREKFLNRLFFKNVYADGHVPNTRQSDRDFLNFWQFRRPDLYKGLPFHKAKSHFNRKLAAFHAINDDLIKFEQLDKTQNSNVHEKYITSLKEDISKLKETEMSLLDELMILNKQQELELLHESELSISIERLKLNEPGVFSRLFCPKKHTLYKETLSSKLKDLEKVKHSLRFFDMKKCEKGAAKDEVNNQIAGIMSYISSIEAQIKLLDARLLNYKERFEDFHYPKSDDVITDMSRQRHACWQSKEINQLRSDVFEAALQLHEAWLVEATRKSRLFREQIMEINDVVLGKRRYNVASIWQILFMIVPVVSTTFASLGRMFTGLPSESIGWLMIDEAGQAIPQAAVGGLLRAKRAIVVGDPLQIEPVFTSPPELVHFLMDSKLEHEADNWDPCLWSVQTLADRVNPYGCMLEVDQQKRWVGIPLWVHRRCIEPMFSISNAIAYNGRMIHGSDDIESVKPRCHPQLGLNQWKSSKGDCVFKQYKQELGKDVLALLFDIVNNGGDLNKVYIISPFKVVKNKLVEDLRANGDVLIKYSRWSKKQFNSFLSKNIGTVHTFQGKENDTVILVLGCDINNNGGAMWASSKPNLLNVAVTRAKKHLFIVGDPNVWSNKDYFDYAYRKLE
ncbi:TPA: AAA domain-containing protein [Photobacterium damselae]